MLVCNKLFEGKCRYITSDCDAVAVIYEEHKYAKAPEDAVADVIKAGKVVVAWVEYLIYWKKNVQCACIWGLMLIHDAVSLLKFDRHNMTYNSKYLHF